MVNRIKCFLEVQEYCNYIQTMYSFLFLFKNSYDRSKALLEKTRYAKLDQELKTGEKLVMKLKEKMFHERKKVEDKKINLIKKKLEISKQ